MFALRWHAAEDVRLDRVGTPDISQNDDVLVGIEYAGVCTSDVHIAKGLFGGTPPKTLGHEVAGTVLETGAAVTKHRVGDRVALQPTVCCGTCDACAEGNVHLCARRKFPGIDIDGGFAEQMIAPETNWFPVAPELPTEYACLVEPLACVIHAIDILNPDAASRIAITGAGASAYLFLQALKAAGIETGNILVSGRRDKRLGVCKESGAHVVDVREGEFAEACGDHFGSKGPDILILQTGGEQLMRESLDIAARKGILFVYDYMGCPVPFDFGVMQLREISVLTSTGAPPDAMSRALDMMASGHVNLKPLVTHVFDGSDALAAFEMSMSKDQSHVKSIIRF